MKRTFFILLISLGLLSSCSKSSPSPEVNCEQGGEEVQP